ncbi:MAG: hypothetical protein EBR81_02790 [Proteobacteria bacterium]|nr:hypothetical protein [Pseudomonadota bacterium]
MAAQLRHRLRGERTFVGLHFGEETAMKFGNINAFWALLLVPALGALWMAAGHRARNLVQQLVAARLRPLLVAAMG